MAAKTSVTLKGNPITLIGEEVAVGQAAPDFIACDEDLNPVLFSSFRGKPCVLSSVVSLDTPVCDVEMRRFNEEARELSPDIRVFVISMDLPFAQKRWCGAAGADRITALSDHRDASFGTAYGVLIKGLRLLARAVFVIDGQGTVRHKEIVSEIADEPDYETALAAVRDVA